MKRDSNLDIPKSSAEATGNFIKTAQNLCRKVECTNLEETFASTARQETRKCEEYKNETNIKNKMRHDICDAYTNTGIP